VGSSSCVLALPPVFSTLFRGRSRRGRSRYVWIPSRTGRFANTDRPSAVRRGENKSNFGSTSVSFPAIVQIMPGSWVLVSRMNSSPRRFFDNPKGSTVAEISRTGLRRKGSLVASWRLHGITLLRDQARRTTRAVALALFSFALQMWCEISPRPSWLIFRDA
jgi:hypothetical protein